jgi:cytochrome b subunit of formate dehydrogenase
MKTVDILLLSNCTRARVPARRIFVGHDKTIAWVTTIVVLCVIATGIVATAVAGLKQGELALHRDAEAMVAAEKQVKQGGPLVGYKELW